MQSIMAGVRMLVQDEPHEHGAERTPERCDEERRMLTWRITELERTVEKQDRFVKDQDNRISKLTHEANKLKYDLHQTDQRKRSLENVNKALIQEMKEKDKKCKELDEHFKKCNTERIRMEQACRNQQINIHDLEAHNSELEQRLKNQQEKVDKAQKAAMILLTRDVSNDIPDDKVRKLFTDHFSRLSRWSRDNCRSSSFQPGDKLPSELRKVLVVERWPAYLSFDSCSRTAPSTMLEAALSHEVILRLFAHPFFLAGTRNAFFDPATGPGPAPGDSLLSIFNEILKGKTEHCSSSEILLIRNREQSSRIQLACHYSSDAKCRRAHQRRQVTLFSGHRGAFPSSVQEPGQRGSSRGISDAAAGDRHRVRRICAAVMVSKINHILLRHRLFRRLAF